MNLIQVQLDSMASANPIIVPSGQANFSYIKFVFSSDWDGYNKIAQFSQKNNTFNVGLDKNDICYVPTELVVGSATVYVKGYHSEKPAIGTANGVAIKIVQGAKEGGTPSVPPTPDLYTELLNEIQNLKEDLPSLTIEEVENGFKITVEDAINEEREFTLNHGFSPVVNTATNELGTTVTITDVEGNKSFDIYNGEPGPRGPQGLKGDTGNKGEKGEQGVTFIPSISNGILSWTNDGNLQNPESVSIIGPTGATGKGIVSFRKTSTDGLVDVYTISYTDGTSTTIRITNGRDVELPEITAQDEGKFLRVSNGTLVLVSILDVSQTGL